MLRNEKIFGVKGKLKKKQERLREGERKRKWAEDTACK